MKTTQPISITHPEVAKEWHPTKNGDLTPDDVTYGSTVNAWWLCSTCKHEWELTITRKSLSFRKYNSNACPVCSNRVVTINKCLATTHPEVAKEWDFKKNGNLTPNNVTSGSGKNVFWICYKCNNKWNESICSKSHRKENSGCVICRGRSFISLKTKYPELLKYWDYSKNIGLEPNEISKGSCKIVFWECHKCKHKWEESIANKSRNIEQNVEPCPNCRMNIDKDEQTLLSAYWDSNKNIDIKLNDYSMWSSEVVFWKCKTCKHEWEENIRNKYRNVKQNVEICPRCRAPHLYMNESDLIIFLKNLHNKYGEKIQSKSFLYKNHYGWFLRRLDDLGIDFCEFKLKHILKNTSSKPKENLTMLECLEMYPKIRLEYGEDAKNSSWISHKFSSFYRCACNNTKKYLSIEEDVWLCFRLLCDNNYEDIDITSLVRSKLSKEQIMEYHRGLFKEYGYKAASSLWMRENGYGWIVYTIRKLKIKWSSWIIECGFHNKPSTNSSLSSYCAFWHDLFFKYGSLACNSTWVYNNYHWLVRRLWQIFNLTTTEFIQLAMATCEPFTDEELAI